MSDPLAEPDDGAPLTDEESQGLLLPVLTRKELNRAEAENIAQAMTWVFLSRRRLRPESVAREAWLQRLHRRMYDQVWAWAGQYRTTDRNLGVPYWQTRMDMRDLEVDVQAWLADTGTARFSDDECAIPQAAIFGFIPPVTNSVVLTASTHSPGQAITTQVARTCPEAHNCDARRARASSRWQRVLHHPTRPR